MAKAKQMQEVKLSKLTATLDKYAGRQADFSVAHKDVKIRVTGQLQKNDTQYWFTQAGGKVVLMERKAGSMWSLRGTYKVLVVQFLVADTLLAEFEIPMKKGTFRFGVED